VLASLFFAGYAIYARRRARQETLKDRLTPEQRSARSRARRRLLVAFAAVLIAALAVSLSYEYRRTSMRDRCMAAASAEMDQRYDDLAALHHPNGTIPDEFWYTYQDQYTAIITPCLREHGL
jgi:hypothetical protein